MRIVIVEDEVKIREGMGKMISTQTRHLIAGEAADGAEGLEMIRRFKPDLVITDIRMPKMDGLEMLHRLSEDSYKPHIVILSGYSEFDYAKKAIQYGVEDYLLKPLAADDVQEMIEKIEQKIKEEEARAYGLAEGRLKSVLINHEEDNETNRERLRRDCGLISGMKYCMMAGYIGVADAGYRTVVEMGVASLKEKYQELKIYLVYHKNSQTFYCLAMGLELEDELLERYKRSFYNRMLSLYQNKTEYPIWSMSSFSDKWISDVSESLRECLSYALVLRGEQYITEEMIANYVPEEFEYPKEIENSLKNAIYQENQERIEKETGRLEHFLNEHHFKPSDIRHTYVKSYYMAADTLRDLDQSKYEQLVNAGILRYIESAITFEELKEAFSDVVKIVSGPKARREDISNYVIKKAINYIREHYQEGLSLEEVSRRLDITPEYLSTLFNREVGINFSVFLKRFRLSHAKRMLKGSEMKIYEIAEAVGYSDAKYFARVFKEEEGVSPVEYRQMD